MNEIVAIIQFVVTAVWRVWPAFLISIFLSVLIRNLKLDGTIRRAFAARVGLSILLATAVGAFSPFCSCTVVPIVAGMLLSGVPLAPVMSFWIASPTMDPEIFALSVGVLGWPMALTRLGATLVLSLLAGYLTLAVSRTSLLKQIVRGEAQTKPAACCAAEPADLLPVGPQPAGMMPLLSTTPLAVLDTPGGGGGCTANGCNLPAAPSSPGAWSQFIAGWREIVWPDFWRETGRQSWLLGRWLLLAFVLEALISRYVPQAAVAGTLGKENALAVPLAALVGIPLYLNNFSALPIVAGLLEHGMQPGAAIAFLIAGPVTTIPALMAVWGVVRRRVFALYLGIGLLGSMVMGLLANILLGG